MRLPPSRVKLRSQCPSLGGIAVRFARSAPLLGLFPASNLPRRWDLFSLDDFWALDSLSLLVRYPFGSGSAAILRKATRKNLLKES